MQKDKNLMTAKVGRPSVIDKRTVAILVDVIKCGLPIEIACQSARINKATFYRHLQSDPDFATKIMDAKIFLVIRAASTLYNILTDENNKYSDYVKMRTAMFVLERKDPEGWGKKCRNCTRNFNPYIDGNIILATQ